MCKELSLAMSLWSVLTAHTTAPHSSSTCGKESKAGTCRHAFGHIVGFKSVLDSPKVNIDLSEASQGIACNRPFYTAAKRLGVALHFHTDQGV